MSVMRYLALALFIPLLSACEPEVKPAKVAPPKSPVPAEVPVPGQQSPAPVAAPQAAREQPDAVPPVRAPGSTAPAPSVSANAAAPARTAEPEPPAHASLDLSVPPELLEQANAGGEGEHGLTPLLPPLFEAKAEAGPVQLSGRLITEEAGDWNSLEGAELQFELRR